MLSSDDSDGDVMPESGSHNGLGRDLWFIGESEAHQAVALETRPRERPRFVVLGLPCALRTTP